MSEQTIQNELFSNNVDILDKFTCLNLGATTINDLIKGKLLNSKISLQKDFGKKPDVLIVNKNKEVVIFIEVKLPDEFNTQAKIDKAIKQEIDIAKKVDAKIYVVTDGEKFFWLNPQTGNYVLDKDGNMITREIKPKKEERKLAEFIDLVSLSLFCILASTFCSLFLSFS